MPVSTTLTTSLDMLIGAVTFSGSLVAAGKLQGVIPGRPIVFPGARAGQPRRCAVVALAGGLTYMARHGGVPVLVIAGAGRARRSAC